MNKFLLFSLIISLTSCATRSVSPVFVDHNSNIIFSSDPVKVPKRLAVEQKAVMLLNQLFNTDSSNEKMILVISNDSDCDFTMNISGHENYIIPVAAGKTESIILKEGEYVLRSEICQSAYLSKKIISENMQVNIKHKVVTTPANPN